MFSTLKYRSTSSHNTKKLIDVRHSSRPRTRGPHLACRACHSKKVKCSGQKDGCDRCRNKAVQCFYVKQNRTAPESQSNSTTVPNSNNKEFAAIADIAPSLGDTTDSSMQRMSNWLLDAGTEANLEGTTTIFQESQPPRNKQSWDHPIQSIEDDIGAGEGQEMSLDSTHGNVPMEGNADSSFEASQFIDFGDNLTMSAHETCDFSEFSTFAYDPISMSLHESDTVHNWDIPRMTPPSDPEQFQLKIPETLDPSTGLLYISPEITPPATTPPISTDSASCQCTDTAVRVLEALQIGNSKHTPSPFDRMLRLKQQAIDECTTIIDCALCSTSPLVMLLVVICEKLVVSFETWSRKYWGKNPSAAKRRSGSEDEDGERKFSLGIYDVDVEEEQCSLLRALAMVQLRRLTLLLGKLGGVARNRDWGAHQALLNSFMARTQCAAQGLVARF